MGRRRLKEQVKDRHIGLIVRLVSDHEGLCQLAEEYGKLTSFLEFRENYYQRHIERYRLEATKTAAPGRVIDFAFYKEAKRILEKRCHRYGNQGQCLFPREELGSHRAIVYMLLLQLMSNPLFKIGLLDQLLNVVLKIFILLAQLFTFIPLALTC